MEGTNARTTGKHVEIAAVRRGDVRYPPMLAAIHDAPQTLFVRGDLAALTWPSLAVVGTRKMTTYGLTAVRLLVPAAVHAGFGIVSGLALGTDAAAHAACLDAGGVTVAALAGGVDAPSVGPRTNAALAERMTRSGGALVSEHPPGTHPTPAYFPQRNRIIAGLCRATIVIEAAAKSGALITAYRALDEGRDVLAVPGSITSPASAGTNGLIRRGATPITCAAELLEALGAEAALPSPTADAPKGDAGAVFAALADGPLHADDIANHCGITVPRVLAALTVLSLDGRASEAGGAWSKN